MKKIKRLFGGAFHDRHVDEFVGFRDMVDGFDVCDFEESKISHYAEPAPVRNGLPLRVRYMLTNFRFGSEQRSVWVYDPKECEAICENDRGRISDKFYVFLCGCIEEEAKDF